MVDGQSVLVTQAKLHPVMGDGVGVGVGVGNGVGVGAKAKTVNWVVHAAGVPGVGVGAPTKFTWAVKLSKFALATVDINSGLPVPV